MLFEKQDYQYQCVKNICSILSHGDMHKGMYDGLHDALTSHYKEHAYTQFATTNAPQLDVLMETGTGKTYTYLKTIFELYKTYKKKKFIIVVPRTAIKLGVIQNMKLTDEHFYNDYKHHLKYINYPEDGLDAVRSDFVRSDALSILLLTNASFNGKDNVINKKLENLFEHDSMWGAIADAKPVIFIDEPHLLKGGKTIQALEKLTQSLFIRFGATYPQEKEHALCNVAYALDSISSFNKYLVKRIRVNTVISDHERGALTITETKAKEKQFTVVYDINTVSYSRLIRVGDDIGAITGLDKYRTICATKVQKDKVFFSDKTTLEVQKSGYMLSDEEMRMMIRATIEKHFEKEEVLFDKGVKALSLFFIPRVDHFRGDNPLVKNIFEEEYKTIRRKWYEKTDNEQYRHYLDGDFVDGTLHVHEGYFSGDKGTSDTKEAQGVKLILQEKERLLSFDTPLRFIFSVWALQEGWDNPNVFTICKLCCASTSNYTSRRQQVGRGLRLAVNAEGKRYTFASCQENEQDFYAINTLDMVIAGKEKEFICEIQQEIQDASFSFVGDIITLDMLKNKNFSDVEASAFYSVLYEYEIINAEGVIQSSVVEFLQSNREMIQQQLKCTDARYQHIVEMFTKNKNAIIDGNKKVTKVKLRESKWREFRELWETLNKKSKIVYKDIDEKEIVQKVVTAFIHENIAAVQVKIETKTYNAQKNKIEINNMSAQGTVDFFKHDSFTDFLDVFIKDEKLPLQFVLKLFSALHKEGAIETIKNNPQKSKETLVHIMKEIIHTVVINKVSYRCNETTIYPNALQNSKSSVKESLESGVFGRSTSNEKVPSHLLYDTICYDSDIEKKIQHNAPHKVGGKTIKVFAKLPRISIPTPYKSYSPDFAYLIETEDNKKLFLVVETKGYEYQSDISAQETQKIKYAEKFFQALQEALKKEHPDIKVHYAKQLKNQDFSDIIREISL